VKRREFLKLGSNLATAAVLGAQGYKYIRASYKDTKACELPQGSFFSVSPVVFDLIMGFRWLPGPIRWVGIVNNEVIFDNAYSGNNYGYICSYNYAIKKRSKETFRFVVLGDSFTAGLELSKPWPERLQQVLQSRSEKRHVEVYPFPIDGGGLLNWYSVFTNQILPEFDFDALIIASWYENLNREFVVYHSDESYMYIKHFAKDQWPMSKEAFEKVRPTMEKLFKVLGVRELEQLVTRVRQEGKSTSVSVDHYCRRWGPESEVAPQGYEFSTGNFVNRYSAERLAIFAEIIDACRKRHTPVIFCAVPTRQGLLRIRKENVALIHRTESEGICSHFDLGYFDGYAAFDGVGAKSIVDLYWLKYDSHWAQAAADLFALRLAEWITAKKIIPPISVRRAKD